MRSTPLPGAVLTRVAASHIRVGTFQYAAAVGRRELLQSLLDYAIARHDPELADLDAGDRPAGARSPAAARPPHRCRERSPRRGPGLGSRRRRAASGSGRAASAPAPSAPGRSRCTPGTRRRPPSLPAGSRRARGSRPSSGMSPRPGRVRSGARRAEPRRPRHAAARRPTPHRADRPRRVRRRLPAARGRCGCPCGGFGLAGRLRRRSTSRPRTRVYRRRPCERAGVPADRSRLVKYRRRCDTVRSQAAARRDTARWQASP